jgi:two-component sensor histidine kinase
MQTEARNNDALDSIKALLLITKNRIAMRESNRRVNEKLENIDSKLNQTALDTELNQTAMVILTEMFL